MSTEMTSWHIEVYDPNAKLGEKGAGNPSSEYGVGWYRDGANSKADVRKGDLIFVRSKIENKHELAFYLAVEHTKQEIAKLFDGAGGMEVAGMKLQDIFKMDEEAMKSNKVKYNGSHTKL